MIIVSEVRCSDCLAEFGAGPKFAVIKEDKSQAYNDEERLLGGHLFQVLVCADCVGWYGDDAFLLKDESASRPPQEQTS